MFTRVVVGVDGFRTDLDAIAVARAVAPQGAVHDLVTVYPDGDQQPSRGFDDYRAQLREDAQHLLESQRAASVVPDAEVHAIPDYAPARALKDYASTSGADLIVLGAGSRGALDRALVGDVARAVLHGAPCPVLCVAASRTSGGGRPATIGVAYDGTPEAEAALALATGLAAELGARLEIVQAVDVSISPRVWGPQLAEYMTELAELQVGRMRDLAEALPVEATGLAVHGSARQALHDLSGRVDLLVCGSRGWGTAGRIAFGSTADYLVHHSPCPVIVVPRSAVAGSETPEEPALSSVAGGSADPSAG